MDKKTIFSAILAASLVSVILNLSTYFPTQLLLKPVLAQDISSMVKDAMNELNQTRVALQAQNITMAMTHLDQIEKDLISLNGTATTPSTVQNQNQNQTSLTINKNLPTNTIQLNAKEKKEVYTWANKDGTNPVLNLELNTNNVVQIKNPTDTKHELVITSGGKEITASGDINPGSTGQLSFSPTTTTGTFQYHCQYHPDTMKGIIKLSSP